MFGEVKNSRATRKATKKPARPEARRSSAGRSPVKSARKTPAARRDGLTKSERDMILRSLRKPDDVGRLLAEWDRDHPAGK